MTERSGETCTRHDMSKGQISDIDSIRSRPKHDLELKGGFFALHTLRNSSTRKVP